MKNEILLEAKNLSIGYGKKIVCPNINFSLKKGEVISIIGKNGAGKSTLLKTILKEIPHLDGEIFVNSKNLNSLQNNELAQNVSALLTFHPRAEQMTCFDVVALSRYPHTNHFGKIREHDKNKILESLALVDALDFADKAFSTLSDGQKQRVLIARSICQDAPVLLLDEPFSFLDLKYSLELLELLKSLALQKKIGILMAVHDVAFALKVSDSFLCFEDSKCVLKSAKSLNEAGTVEKIFSMEQGSFDSVFLTAELKATFGKPKVFVLSCGENGSAIYRELQRKNIPFATGILSEGNIDFHLAKRFASFVVSVPPFCAIDEEIIVKAKKIIDECEIVLDAGGDKKNSAFEKLRLYAGEKLCKQI